MTDNEIIKALECCLKGCNAEGCDDCPLYEKVEDCEIEIPIIALDLINRQKAEIEKLQSDQYAIDKFARDLCKERMLKGKAIADFEDLQDYIKKEKTEAIREFVKQHKEIMRGFLCNDSTDFMMKWCEYETATDNLVKETTEESNDQQKT